MKSRSTFFCYSEGSPKCLLSLNWHFTNSFKTSIPVRRISEWNIHYAYKPCLQWSFLLFPPVAHLGSSVEETSLLLKICREVQSSSSGCSVHTSMFSGFDADITSKSLPNRTTCSLTSTVDGLTITEYNRVKDAHLGSRRTLRGLGRIPFPAQFCDLISSDRTSLAKAYTSKGYIRQSK
jgi:hypothetical protein